MDRSLDHFAGLLVCIAEPLLCRHSIPYYESLGPYPRNPELARSLRRSSASGTAKSCSEWLKQQRDTRPQGVRVQGLRFLIVRGLRFWGASGMGSAFIVSQFWGSGFAVEGSGLELRVEKLRVASY